MVTSFVTSVGQRYAVTESAHVGAVRREALTLANDAGFSETVAGRLAIVVSELCSNLLKHGGGGELLLARVRDDDRAGIEVLAVDKGEGLSNLSRCMADGYSTAGSLGLGLGAVVRLSQEFDVYARPRAGTAVLARVWRDGVSLVGVPGQARVLRVGGVAVPKLGQSVSGDAWALTEVRGTTLLLMVDGLGHGEHAALTAAEALRFFQQNTLIAPLDILKGLHEALRPTRGAVGAVAALHPAEGVLRYAGVGNIAALLMAPDGTRRHLMSYDGTLGYQVRTMREMVHEWLPGSWMAWHSDGLSPRLDTMAYPGLSQHEPALAASVLYRDFHRTHDDATVLVVNYS